MSGPALGDVANKVLVLGAASVGKSTLVASMFRDAVPEPLALATVDQVRCYPHTVSTKYYDADVHVCDVPSALLSDAQADALLLDEILRSAQALVLTFRLDELASFELLQRLVRQMPQRAAICLCVATHGDEHLDRPDYDTFVQPFVDWCIDEHFEFIPADARELRDDTDEPEGVARVLDALHAHLWPNMRMRERRDASRGRSLLGSSSSREIDDLPDDVRSDAARLALGFSAIFARDGDDADDAHGDDGADDDADDGGDSDADDVGDDEEAADAAARVRLAALQAKSDAPAPLDSDILTPPPAAALAAGSVPTTQKQVDNFDDMLQQISSMKARAEQMSGDERHAFSRNVALALWSQLVGNSDDDLEEFEAMVSDVHAAAAASKRPR